MITQFKSKTDRKLVRIDYIPGRKGSNQHLRKSRVSVRAFLATVISLAAFGYGIGSYLLTPSINNTAYIPPMKKAYAKPVAKKMPMPVKQLNPQQRVDWEAFKLKAKILSTIYDFPVNVLLSQAALESARGTSNFAIERNNYFGMNAVDEDPNLAFSYDNAEQSIIDYMQRIRKYYREAYDARHDPELMIRLIKDGGYATDPEYVQKVMNMDEWGIK